MAHRQHNGIGVDLAAVVADHAIAAPVRDDGARLCLSVRDRAVKLPDMRVDIIAERGAGRKQRAGNLRRRIARRVSFGDQPLLEMTFLVEVEIHLQRGHIDAVRRIAAIIGEAAADLVARLNDDNVVRVGRRPMQMPRQHRTREPAADNHDCRKIAGGGSFSLGHEPIKTLWRVRRPDLDSGDVQLFRDQAFAEERVGDLLLFGQPGRLDRADPVTVVAVGFLDGGRIDAPEAGERRGGFLRIGFHPLAGVAQLGEHDVQSITAAIGEGFRGEIIALVAGEPAAAVTENLCVASLRSQ